MLEKNETRFCRKCQKTTPMIKETPNRILHLLMTVITAGFYLPLWIIIEFCGLSEEWYCQECWKDSASAKQDL
jgi:hypothetical protein